MVCTGHCNNDHHCIHAFIRQHPFIQRSLVAVSGSELAVGEWPGCSLARYITQLGSL